MGPAPWPRVSYSCHTPAECPCTRSQSPLLSLWNKQNRDPKILSKNLSTPIERPGPKSQPTQTTPQIRGNRSKSILSRQTNAHPFFPTVNNENCPENDKKEKFEQRENCWNKPNSRLILSRLWEQSRRKSTPMWRWKLAQANRHQNLATTKFGKSNDSIAEKPTAAHKTRQENQGPRSAHFLEKGSLFDPSNSCRRHQY